jgi:hypothetical protein
MNGYQYIQSLFRSILLQSKQIQGRLVLMPEGDELNYDDFKRVLSEVTTGSKFPCAAWKPPRSSGKFVAKYDEWEEYRMEMFFLNTTFYTGTNQIAKPNPGTRTSSKSVIEEWDEMKVAAVDFIRVLQLVLKGNNTDSVNMLDVIQLSSKEKFIDPISFTGTSRLSGVRLSFILKIFTNCNIQDYVDGGLIVLPDSDDSSFDADLVVVRNEVLTIVRELGWGSYTHTQSVASAIWTINHNLGYRPGGISVVDSAETQVIGDIEYVNDNILKITFNGGFSGKAYLS